VSLRCALVLARVILAVGIGFFSARPAVAQPQSFSFEWKAPSGCPSSDFVLTEMTRLLGHAPGLASDRPVSLEATVGPVTGGYFVRIRLTTTEGSGDRTFRNASCERLALATALAASLAIDPEAVSARAASSSPELPPPEPPPPVAASSAPPADSPPRQEEQKSHSDERVRFLLGPEIGAVLGTFPDAALRLAVVVGLEFRRFRYELAGGYDLPQYVPAPEDAARGARLQLNTFKFRASYAAVEGAVELDACLSTEAGWFLAEGVGISSPERNAYPWWAVFSGARLLWRLRDRLEWRLTADVGASLVRPEFQITGTYPTFVHQPSAIIGQGMFSAVVRFP
jgi:hypothetical protein